MGFLLKIHFSEAQETHLIKIDRSTVWSAAAISITRLLVFFVVGLLSHSKSNDLTTREPKQDKAAKLKARLKSRLSDKTDEGTLQGT